jgi:hypothetical protein
MSKKTKPKVPKPEPKPKEDEVTTLDDGKPPVPPIKPPQ